MSFSRVNFLKIKKIALIAFLGSFLFTACSRNIETINHDLKKQDSVFLVLAHPDDETMLGGLLLELKRLNIPVYAMYITSGEGGKRLTLDAQGQWMAKSIDASKLKEVREHDLEQVATNYGIKDYFLLEQKDTPLRNKDGLPIREGKLFLEKNIWQKKMIQKKLVSLLSQYQPSYVIAMSLDEHTHAHHKASRLILDELKITQRFSFIKGVYAFTETGWIKPSLKDEKKFPKLTLDRKQNLPGSNIDYATLNAQVAGGHYSQHSGHTGPWSHKEEFYQIEGSLLEFYKFLCKSRNCNQRIQYTEQ
ncbi:PIG-L family deacetylase [bacterium]|nr:PIG-L family deacetylase [bacterium]